MNLDNEVVPMDIDPVNDKKPIVDVCFKVYRGEKFIYYRREGEMQFKPANEIMTKAEYAEEVYKKEHDANPLLKMLIAVLVVAAILVAIFI